MGIATLWITFYHCKYLNLFNSAFLTRTRLLGLFTRVEAIGNCDAAVLVAMAEISTYKGTGDVLDAVRLLGREVAGSIVLM